jgi:hypothetical protein
MQKSKKSVENKLKRNETKAHDVSRSIEMNFKKSVHSAESATMPGLGSEDR